MSIAANLAPYLNRFVILLRQNSVAKLELGCQNGKLTVNISHVMGVIEQATPKPNTPPSYNEGQSCYPCIIVYYQTILVQNRTNFLYIKKSLCLFVTFWS